MLLRPVERGDGVRAQPVEPAASSGGSQIVIGTPLADVSSAVS